MIITNRNNYPETIVQVVTNDPYDKGDSEFSATGLIRPPRIRVLSERHFHEIKVDVDERIFSLYGQITHVLLERAGATNPLKRVVEKRFFTVVSGTKISAQIDSLSIEPDQTLIDWKFTTVYGFKIGRSPKPEYTQQMNVQLELLRRNGFDAKRLQIWGLLRDWRPREAEREKDYPFKLASHTLKIWPREKTVAWIEKRIEQHREAEIKLPLCNKADHWGFRRCKSYCEVSEFCDQWKETKEAMNGL